MVRGGEELLQHCAKRLGVGTQTDHARRPVHAGRSGMHRRLQLGSGSASELRFSREPDDRKDGPDS